METSETVVTEGVEVETEPLETEETFEPPQPVLQQQPQPQQQVHEDVGMGEFTAIVFVIYKPSVATCLIYFNVCSWL